VHLILTYNFYQSFMQRQDSETKEPALRQRKKKAHIHITNNDDATCECQQCDATANKESTNVPLTTCLISVEC
jgi:hypothetical protein